MTYAYSVVAILLVYLSYRSLRGGIDYRNYFNQELSKPRSEFVPFATVIVPCKGLDDGLSANLKSLVSQDYPQYEVIFVVEDIHDPAVPLIEETSRKGLNPAKLVVAAAAVDSGQKVENLREAVLHADQGSEVFVFVDSDVCPGRNLLRSLIAPLADETIGAATGYRWFVSERSNFATELRAAWNASIASVQGPDMTSNFCWGGSMAFRRDVFERLCVRENWSGTLSDDLAATRLLNAAGMRIYFVPGAIVPSTGSCSLSEMFEFTNRQIKIVRVYAQRLWLISFLGSGLFTLVMAVSVAMIILYPAGTVHWILAVTTLLLVSLLSIGKAWLRCDAIRSALTDHRPALDRQLTFQITLWLLAPAVFLVNCCIALFSRRISWRGTEYEMVSASVTRVLRP